MTGSKTTTMTLEEMRAARERGESKSELDRVQRMVRDGIEPAEDEGSPNVAATDSLSPVYIAKVRSIPLSRMRLRSRTS